MSGRTKADFLVAEYVSRQSLAKIGYRFNGEELDEFTARVFTIISGEIAKIEDEEHKKASRKRK